MTRKRVLLLSPLPPPAGGIATWTRLLLGSSLLERYDLRVVDTTVGAAATQQAGISMGKLRVSARTASQLLVEMMRFRPSVVHINTSALLPGFFRDAGFAAVAKAHGARTVLHFHGSGFQTLMADPRRHGRLRGALRAVDHVLVLNPMDIDHLAWLGYTSVRQVPNFVAGRPAVGRADRKGPVRVLLVGWLMRAKGVMELLEAVAEVPEVHLTLLGRYVPQDGVTAEAEVRQTIARLGLSERVAVHGEVPLDDVWRYYDNADVFALPSYTEGFPLVLLEAMVSGLPVVVTPVGAIPQIVSDGETGFLVPVRDVSNLADRLRRLAQDPDLRRRLGDAGRARVLSRYEREAVVPQIAAVYEDVLGNRRGRTDALSEPGPARWGSDPDRDATATPR